MALALGVFCGSLSGVVVALWVGYQLGREANPPGSEAEPTLLPFRQDLDSLGAFEHWLQCSHEDLSEAESPEEREDFRDTNRRIDAMLDCISHYRSTGGC